MKQQKLFSFTQFYYLYHYKKNSGWVAKGTMDLSFKEFLRTHQNFEYGKDWFYAMYTNTNNYKTNEPIFSANKTTKLFTADLVNEFLEYFANETNTKLIKLNKLNNEKEEIQKLADNKSNMSVKIINIPQLTNDLTEYKSFVSQFTNLNKIDASVTKTLIGKIIAATPEFYQEFFIDETGVAYVDKNLKENLINFMIS